MNPLDKMIVAAVRCTICGAGYGKCDCWQKCPACGWSFRKGGTCRNCAGDGKPEIMAIKRSSRVRRATDGHKARRHPNATAEADRPVDGPKPYDGRS